MNNSFEDRLQKTQDRIEDIKSSIKAHRKNIDKLHAFYAIHQVVDSYNYAPRVVRFTCLPKSEKYYRWTVENLTTQITVLEQELAILAEYGA